ncbi:MAG: hypothetical protein F6K35_06080, partial [Okeania sp. SIO2H7]|nr:hypothetical protein [Okeania sp. SIO2H7]
MLNLAVIYIDNIFTNVEKKETGDRRQEMEKGVRRQESGDRRWKKESGDRSQETGVRRQELELCFLERSLKKELIDRMKREPAKN